MSIYKMICLDIDGTLLNSNHEISTNTVDKINELCNEKNIKVILVSARMKKGIDFIQRKLHIKQPIICYSGAEVLDENYNLITNKYIDFDLAIDIIRESKNKNIHVSLYNDNNWIIEKMDKWSQIEKDITGIIPEIEDINCDEFINKYKKGFNKILLIEEPKRINEIKNILIDRYSEYLNIYQSKPTYLEIMNKSVSKTEAIKEIMNIYDIKQEEIIAVGDNFNDMDMIKFAAVGVAMGNAPDMVKEISDYVTLSNDEDGVAVVIEKYFD